MLNSVLKLEARIDQLSGCDKSVRFTQLIESNGQETQPCSYNRIVGRTDGAPRINLRHYFGRFADEIF